ncbi:MAG: hypothetical protein IK045_01770 [Bacteroidales bacterium]|nr:hypothetical protein [Bacteroidales bacterium]
MAGKRHILRNLLLGAVGFFVIVLVALQIALSPKVLARIVRRLAVELVPEGEVEFSGIRASVVRNFPRVGVTIDDFSLTYPHDRYAAFDSLYSEGPVADHHFSLLEAGRGEEKDTLASFRRLHASVNLLRILKGEYLLPKVELSRPRIFAHYYDSTAANWDILPIGKSSDEAEDTTKSGTVISLRRILLDNRPFVVFTDPADTLYALATMREMSYKGALSTRDISATLADLSVDSLFVAGRLPADTLAAGLDHLELKGSRDGFDLKASATAKLMSSSIGRLDVPVKLKTAFALPPSEQGFAVSVKSLDLQVAPLHMTGEGDAVFYGDSTFLRAELLIDDCPVADMLDFAKDIFPAGRKIKTDAKLSLTALCDGIYSKPSGTIPEILAELVVPPASLSFSGLPYKGTVSFDVNAETSSEGRLDATLDEVMADIRGAQLLFEGDAKDLLGEDPAFNLEGFLDADIEALTEMFTADAGIYGRGSLSADMALKAKLSQLSLSKIAGASVRADLKASGVHVDDLADSLNVDFNSAKVSLGISGNKIDNSLRKGARVLSLDAAIDTLLLGFKDEVYMSGGKIKLLAQNSAAVLSGGKSIQPFMGLFKASSVNMRDIEGTSVDIEGTTETFRIIPPKGETGATLRLTGRNSSINLISGMERVSLDSLNFNLTASQALRKRRASSRMSRMLDSLQRLYPGVPRDTIARRYHRALRSSGADELSSGDIKISLGGQAKQYYRDWNLAGDLSLHAAELRTPQFPIRISADRVKGSFTNDEIRLDNFTLRAGRSDVTAKGRIHGLRRALLGRGIIYLDANVDSDYIDANELLWTYAYSATHKPSSEFDASQSDATYDSALEEAISEVDSVKSPLIIVPRNLNANISLNANQIKYDNLLVTWAASDISMRDRCLQVTNTVATSNMGDIYFEGFYSTQSKKDIKAGFDLNLVDITAEKVISLFPAVDTLMPILKSFSGLLDLEMVATSDLDENMNIVLPSIDGVIKISGKDLTLQDSEQFTKIAKILVFKNKKKAVVDKMSVDGMVRDNSIEIFPFVLKVDRYTLAASGIQSLDESYKYHISVIKSPLLIRFGINVFGDNFDQMKFRLGKARYKNTRVPVFTKQLDTVQINLVNSIHNIFELGVEKAIRDNREQNLIREKMALESYSVNAEVDTMTRAQLDSLTFMQDSLSIPEEERLKEKLDTLDAQVKDSSYLDGDISRSSMRKDARKGRKAEREVAKAARRSEKAAKKAAKQK